MDAGNGKKELLKKRKKIEDKLCMWIRKSYSGEKSERKWEEERVKPAG